MKRKPPARSANRTPGAVRIIAGRWRGTRLPVADAEGLRPTSDRVRETLFNWLQPMLPGARVLDLFAGSGALGLEALSRGAASAVLVERDPALAATLRASVARLQAEDCAQVACADALAFLRAQAGSPARFDLVFLDPPFAADCWGQALASLPPVLANGAWLYVESPPGTGAPDPAAWTLHREGTTREVRYALYRARDRAAAAAATLATDLDPDGTSVKE
jgi:16S rRNA (guanine966-N2)-methyltransferase